LSILSAVKRVPVTAIAVAVAVSSVLVVVSHLASDRVNALLTGHAEALRGLRGLGVLAPGAIGTSEGVAQAQEGALEAGSAEQEEDVVDLEHPTEKDWRFLLGVLEKGTPEGRASATRVLVEVGQLRAVQPLFGASSREDALGSGLGELHCAGAMEILRFQLQEDALAEMLVALDEGSPTLSLTCRDEVSTRFRLAGGRDPAVVARLAGREDLRVRRFAARFLSEQCEPEHRGLLEGLARDEDPVVREAAEAGLERLKASEALSRSAPAR
jgi:HEAT repeat protein